MVEQALGVVRAQLAAEGKAQVGDVRAGARAHKTVHVDAHQRCGREVVGRLFQHLAHAGLDGRFGGVEVTGRGIQAQTVRGLLLHQQKALCALHDGRHGDIGFPAIGHGPRLSGPVWRACVSPRWPVGLGCKEGRYSAVLINTAPGP